MSHALRGPDGHIDSLHREAAPDRESLHENGADEAFAHLDAGLIRVLEDLVDVLVARNIIRITDLPPEAQHKLFARKNFRERFQRNALAPAVGDDGLVALPDQQSRVAVQD